MQNNAILAATFKVPNCDDCVKFCQPSTRPSFSLKGLGATKNAIGFLCRVSLKMSSSFFLQDVMDKERLRRDSDPLTSARNRVLAW